MPYLTLNGRQTYYEDHGQGPAVVLLHHGFAGSEMWRPILPPLVMAGFRVLMYDRRGYGKTEGGPDFREFYLSERFRPEMARDLVAFLDGLGLEAAHLAGQCEGGVLALDCAGLAPERVKSLTAASTQCYSEVGMREFNLRAFPNHFRDLDPKLREKIIFWHDPETAEERFELFRFLGGAYGTGVFDIRPQLPEISTPALVLYPDRSALFPVEQAVAMYRGLANGRLAVLPACGHNTYEQKPSQYAAMLLEFLAETEYGRGAAPPFLSTCAG